MSNHCYYNSTRQATRFLCLVALVCCSTMVSGVETAVGVNQAQSTGTGTPDAIGHPLENPYFNFTFYEVNTTGCGPEQDVELHFVSPFNGISGDVTILPLKVGNPIGNYMLHIADLGDYRYMVVNKKTGAVCPNSDLYGPFFTQIANPGPLFQVFDISPMGVFPGTTHTVTFSTGSQAVDVFGTVDCTGPKTGSISAYSFGSARVTFPFHVDMNKPFTICAVEKGTSTKVHTLNTLVPSSLFVLLYTRIFSQDKKDVELVFFTPKTLDGHMVQLVAKGTDCNALWTYLMTPTATLKKVLESGEVVFHANIAGLGDLTPTDACVDIDGTFHRGTLIGSLHPGAQAYYRCGSPDCLAESDVIHEEGQ